MGLTAWQALFDHTKLTAGQRVLINGAGGAVGGYAVQLAKNAGALRLRRTAAGKAPARSSAGCLSDAGTHFIDGVGLDVEM